jgi:predicted RNA-binding Zn ribbon-like protein
MPPGRPRRPPAEVRPPFTWIAGALCLDFVNTVTWLAPGEFANERFRTSADVAEWAQTAGLPLTRHGPDHDWITDEQTLKSARKLRSLLHGVLMHVAGGTTPDVRDVDRLNEWIRSALDHTRLQPRGQMESWVWSAATETLPGNPSSILFGLIVHSAVELLRSPEVSLLRLCANERCGWLFLDRSRKQNRRWCEMRECGARAKARRYRSRRRSATSESGLE